jgi:hypothetical protein
MRSASPRTWAVFPRSTERSVIDLLKTVEGGRLLMSGARMGESPYRFAGKGTEITVTEVRPSATGTSWNEWDRMATSDSLPAIS